MRKSLAITLGIVLLLGMQCASFADAPNPTVKWSQLPDMGNGHQFSSEVKVPSIVADDWTSPDGKPITDIHWWGGYWTPVAYAQYSYYNDSLASALAPGTPQTFTIDIWSNAPAGGSQPFSKPASVLQTYMFELADVHEVLYGATSSGRTVYQYYVDLPEHFQQAWGTTYWLSIRADLPRASVQWGWHESNDHRMSPAVQAFKGSGWIQLQNNQYDNDMAFELTTIPEPGGLSVMCTGVVSLAALLYRRRRA